MFEASNTTLQAADILKGGAGIDTFPGQPIWLGVRTGNLKVKLHITEKAIKEATIPTGRKHVLIFDTEQTGFTVQKTITGSMSYVVLYRNEQKKQRQERLAKVGDISANAARAMAKAQLEALEEQKKGQPERHPFLYAGIAGVE